MKTRIYDFIQYVIDEMSFTKVYILFTLLASIITAPLIILLFEPGPIRGSIGVFIFSSLASLNFLRVVHTSRKDTIFWNAVHDFQGDLNEAKTKQDVISLRSKLYELRKISLGGKHTIKLNELLKVMMVKFELLPHSDKK